MISKIADQHLSRQACIYIRQSTMGQVRFNQVRVRLDRDHGFQSIVIINSRAS